MTRNDSKIEHPMLLLDKNSVSDAPPEEMLKLQEISTLANQRHIFINSKQLIQDIPIYPLLAPFVMGADDSDIVLRHSTFIEQSATELNAKLPQHWQLHEVELANVCVYRNQILIPQHDWAILHELNRPEEKNGWEPLDHFNFDKTLQLNFAHSSTPTLFVTCAGSHNWGHFLVEDLPRIVNFVQRQTTPEIRILMTDFSAESPSLAKHKQEIIQGLFPHRVFEFIFLQREVATFIDSVKYLTPIARHPRFHSRELIQAMVSQFLLHNSPNTKPSKKLLLLRRDTRRLDEEVQRLVIEMLSPHGFELVYPEDLNGLEQAKLFSNASHIIGTIGAAMANIVFAPKHAKIIYLSPSEWRELYYWDLACIRNEGYFAYYGQTIDNENIQRFKRDYTLDITLLRNFLQEVLFK